MESTYQLWTEIHKPVNSWYSSPSLPGCHLSYVPIEFTNVYRQSQQWLHLHLSLTHNREHRYKHADRVQTMSQLVSKGNTVAKNKNNYDIKCWM